MEDTEPMIRCPYQHFLNDDFKIRTTNHWLSIFHVSRNPPSSAAGMLLHINVNFLTHKVDKVYKHPAFLNKY
jgi:hypothetical protein